MLTWPAKDPAASYVYSWQVDLEEGDAIASRTATVASGSATIDLITTVDDIVNVTILGGDEGETILIELLVIGASGNHYPASFAVEIFDFSAELPVSINELRSELRDAPDPDLTLRDIIIAAAEFFEEQTGLTLIAKQHVWALDAWPNDGKGLGDWDGVREGSLAAFHQRSITLPNSPLVSVEQIETFDSANVGTVLASSAYYVDTISKPGRIALNNGESWPLPGRAVNGIIIDYTAGYSRAADIPAHFRRAVKQIAAHWYENRELMDFDNGKRAPMQAQRIIDGARVRRL